MQGVFCNERPRVKRRILPASAWFRSGGRQDKKRVFGRECQNSGASGCNSQTLDGRSATEQTEIYCRTLVQLSKMLLGSIGVTIGFPAAAAGEVAARIFDKAHHIVKRIAQKYADFMGKIGLAAEPAGQLPQKRRVVVRLLRQSVAFLAQEIPHLRLGQHSAELALAVDVHQIPVGLHTALEDADAEALFAQLFVPAADAAGKVGAVARLVAEKSRRL